MSRLLPPTLALLLTVPALGAKTPGYGQKCYPIIEGIETKFKGEAPVAKEKYDEQVWFLGLFWISRIFVHLY